MSDSSIRMIKIDPVASLIGFTMWLSLLLGAIFSFCLLSGYVLPEAKAWLVLAPMAMLLSVFSSVAYRLSRNHA